jgi:hypothetical protein
MRTPRLRCNYVRSLGIEIECGIPTREGVMQLEAFERSDDRFSYGSDGSVSVYRCYDSDAELRYWVYVPEEWVRMVTVLRWLWEEIEIRQNSSCGNHIHVRLHEDFMQLLIFPQFVRFFQHRYLYFARKQDDPQKYLSRIRSQYSSFYSYRNLERQVIDSFRCSGSRYKAINYWSLSESQGTVEFRIMPYAEGFQEHLRMIMFVIKTVEEYCGRFQKGKLELSCSEISLLQGLSYCELYDSVRHDTAVHFYTDYEVMLQEVEVVELQLPEDITIEVTTTL